MALNEVRQIKVEPRPAVGNLDALEACVADEAGRSLFVAEQDWNIWRYGAEPTDPTGVADRAMVDKEQSEGGHFMREAEGLAVINDASGAGYLIASSQGDFTFTVYRSTAPYDFVRKVKIVGSATADGCERTDGIDAVAANLGPAFPNGVFMCQDNTNAAPAPGNMNFKLVRLETIGAHGRRAAAGPVATRPRPPPHRWVPDRSQDLRLRPAPAGGDNLPQRLGLLDARFGRPGLPLRGRQNPRRRARDPARQRRGPRAHPQRERLLGDQRPGRRVRLRRRRPPWRPGRGPPHHRRDR